MKHSVLYADSQVVYAVETVTLMCHVILRGSLHAASQLCRAAI